MGQQVCPSCKATVLSRYNTAPVCAACLRSARAGVQVPSWLWDSLPMRQALARKDVGAVVAILRGTAGLTQLDLANLVDGWSQSTVSLIERGRRDTLYDVRELLRFADAAGMPRKALLPLIFSDPDATLETSGDVEIGEEDMNRAEGMDRRTFGEMAGGLLAGALLPGFVIPDRVDMTQVRYLRGCLRQIRDGYQSGGGGSVLEHARRYFSWARRLLEDGDYTETVGRELLTVAAELGEACGWAAYDRNHQHLARRLYTEAGLLATDSGDATISAHVYTNLAQQATFLARSTGRKGIAREALRHTARAADIARHEPSPRLHALIALREAMAHAELGDELAFRAAISTARRELERGSHPSDPPWAGFVTFSEITGFEAAGYETLPKGKGTGPERAASLYREVLEDSNRSARDRVFYRSRLAGALLRTGDTRQSLIEGDAVLSAVPGVLSARSVIELRPLRAAAEKAKNEEFCAHYDAATKALESA